MTYNPSGFPKITVIDCGLKYNQLRGLLQRGAAVHVIPWNHPIDPETYDGLFISNGPGDPQMCAETIANLKPLLEGKTGSKTKPIFGICLGHQLIAGMIADHSQKRLGIEL
jgi:carbamoyl-phosphate synthase/aspartate carbamoyltransferase/dihydroorotase